MITRLRHSVLVVPGDIRATSPELKVIGVFNPGAIRVNGEIYLLARVAEAPLEMKAGYLFSPRLSPDKGKFNVKTDMIAITGKDTGDVRICRDDSGLLRLAFISHLRLIKLDSSGFEVTHIDESPTFFPANDYEEYGVEDARLTYIDGRYLLTYVGVSRKMGVITALASTGDFKKFNRHGIIFYQENKDVVILPDKFNGKYCAYHRPVARNPFTRTNMEFAYSNDLIHWGEYGPLIQARDGYWDSSKIGAGTVPVRTEKGWLEIYHGVQRRNINEPVGIYRAGAALFDLKNPSKMIARSSLPIIIPEFREEMKGFVGDVVFPTGAVLDEDGKSLLLYCGGADTVVTVSKLSLEEIFDSMEFIK